MHQDQINQIADDALNVAVLHIQDQLGQQHGDIAGIVFAGANGEAILSILRSYIRTELSFKDLPMTPQIIKTYDGFMVETVDGDYLHDAQGNNLFDTREEAARLMQQDAQP